MRILAISDIHNNIACVRKLRAQEKNEYDVIAIPGDIGTQRASEVFETLNTFRCPIVYVHGNWDRMSEDAKLGAKPHLLNLSAIKIGKYVFAGYSDSTTIPRTTYETLSPSDYARQCRKLTLKAIRQTGLGLCRCILLTHDRATHLRHEFPDLLLHMYGHIHTFDVSRRAGTTYVNTSALDRIIPVARKRDRQRILHVNAGNYAVIELMNDGSISVECRLLERNYKNWIVMGARPISNGGMGGELIPEDSVFGDNVRFPQNAR